MNQKKQKKQKKKKLKSQKSKRKVNGYYCPGNGTIVTLYTDEDGKDYPETF